MKKQLILPLLCMLAMASSAQDTARHIRRGWTFGVLPSVAYDADLGLQYGALTNIYSKRQK